jgi:large subunit ribosomal protein L22
MDKLPVLKTKLNHLKIPPRKVRLLVDVIRGLPLQEAEAKLMLSPRRPKDALVKLLRSAAANAKNNHKLDPAKLFIKEIWVDQGPKTGHWTPRSRGSAALIEKKTSHVTLILGVLETAKVPRFTIEIKKKVKKEEKKKPKAEKPEEGEGKKIPTDKPKETKKPDTKTLAKPGAFKKMFQRKSI